MWGVPRPSVISVSPLWEETLRELLLIPGDCETQHRERRQTHGSSLSEHCGLAVKPGFCRLQTAFSPICVLGRGLLLPKLHSSVSRVKAGSWLGEVAHSVKSLLCNHRAKFKPSTVRKQTRNCRNLKCLYRGGRGRAMKGPCQPTKPVESELRIQ